MPVFHVSRVSKAVWRIGWIWLDLLGPCFYQERESRGCLICQRLIKQIQPSGAHGLVAAKVRCRCCHRCHLMNRGWDWCPSLGFLHIIFKIFQVFVGDYISAELCLIRTLGHLPLMKCLFLNTKSLWKRIKKNIQADGKPKPRHHEQRHPREGTAVASACFKRKHQTICFNTACLKTGYIPMKFPSKCHVIWEKLWFSMTFIMKLGGFPNIFKWRQQRWTSNSHSQNNLRWPPNPRWCQFPP